MSPAGVEINGFSWRHAGRKNPTIADMSLTIPPGQKVLLLGESGAGKSTLLAAIAGVLGDDEGHRSGTLKIQPPNATCGLVLQDPDSQVIASRIGDDVAFGLENLGLPREEIFRRVHQALEVVGLHYPLDHPTAELSGGEKQRLAVAGVAAMGAGIMLLDEPTANIDPAGMGDVLAAIDDAHRHYGMTVIVVEHRVEQWATWVDRVVVLGAAERGIIADGTPADVLHTQGPQLAQRGVWVPGIPLELISHTTAPGPAAPWALQCTDVETSWNGADITTGPISCALPAGYSTVITGPNGAGKTTLALTMAGLLDPLGGSVTASPDVAGDAHSSAPGAWTSRELAQRIGFVFQDPEHQFVARTVRQELEIGPAIRAKKKLPWWRKLTGRLDYEDVDSQTVDMLLNRLRLDHLAEANPFSLSGGQKRRLSVATALAAAPAVVLLDEPTFGQDRRTFTEMVSLLRELTNTGVTVASITHDELFVRALGDHHIRLSATRKGKQ